MLVANGQDGMIGQKNHGFSLADEVNEYVKSIDFIYDTVVVIGIGGSYLGTRAVEETLGHEYADHVSHPKKENCLCRSSPVRVRHDRTNGISCSPPANS